MSHMTIEQKQLQEYIHACFHKMPHKSYNIMKYERIKERCNIREN